MPGRGGSIPERRKAAKEKRQAERRLADARRAEKKAADAKEKEEKELLGIVVPSPDAKKRALRDMRVMTSKILQPRTRRQVEANVQCSSDEARAMLLSFGSFQQCLKTGTHISRFSTKFVPKDDIITVTTISQFVRNTMSQLNADIRDRGGQRASHIRDFNNKVKDWLYALIADSVTKTCLDCSTNDENAKEIPLSFRQVFSKSFVNMKGGFIGEDLVGPIVPQVYQDPLKSSTKSIQLRPTDPVFRSVSSHKKEELWGTILRRDEIGYETQLTFGDVQSMMPDSVETTEVIDAVFIALENELEQDLKDLNPALRTCNRVPIAVVPYKILLEMAQTMLDIGETGSPDTNQQLVIAQYKSYLNTTFRKQCKIVVSPRLLYDENRFVLLVGNRLTRCVKIFDPQRHGGYHQERNDELSFALQSFAKSLENAYNEEGKWMKDSSNGQKIKKHEYLDLRSKIPLDVDIINCGPIIALYFEMMTGRPKAIRQEAKKNQLIGRFDLVRRRHLNLLIEQKVPFPPKDVVQKMTPRQQVQEALQLVADIEEALMQSDNAEMKRDLENTITSAKAKAKSLLESYNIASGLALDHPFDLTNLVGPPQLSPKLGGLQSPKSISHSKAEDRRQFQKNPSQDYASLFLHTTEAVPPKRVEKSGISPDQEPEVMDVSTTTTEDEDLSTTFFEGSSDTNQKVNTTDGGTTGSSPLLPSPGSTLHSLISSFSSSHSRTAQSLSPKSPSPQTTSHSKGTPSPQETFEKSLTESQIVTQRSWTTNDPSGSDENSESFNSAQKLTNDGISPPSRSPRSPLQSSHSPKIPASNLTKSIQNESEQSSEASSMGSSTSPKSITSSKIKSINDGNATEESLTAESGETSYEEIVEDEEEFLPLITPGSVAGNVVSQENPEQSAEADSNISQSDQGTGIQIVNVQSLAVIKPADQIRQMPLIEVCRLEAAYHDTIQLGKMDLEGFIPVELDYKDVKTLCHPRWFNNFVLDAMMGAETQFASFVNTDSYKPLLYIPTLAASTCFTNEGSIEVSKNFPQRYRNSIITTIQKMKTEGRDLVVLYNIRKDHWTAIFVKLAGYRIDMYDPKKPSTQLIMNHDTVRHMRHVRKMVSSALEIEESLWNRDGGDEWPMRQNYFGHPLIPVQTQKEDYNCGLFVKLRIELYCNRPELDETRLQQLGLGDEIEEEKELKADASCYFRSRLWKEISTFLIP